MSTSPEPMVIRLSFWMPPERIPQFAAAYDTVIAPLVRDSCWGITPADRQGRPTIDSVYSRLYESPVSPKAAVDSNYWHFGSHVTRGTFWGDALKRYDISRVWVSAYSYPAEAAALPPVPAGCGKGQWRTFGMSDGLPDVAVRAICEDRHGDLWFGTDGGVSRYDGNSFRNYTHEDGLPFNHVQAIVENSDGSIWAGTGGMWNSLGQGVARFDGERWETFNRSDGLANNTVLSLLVDSEDNLWLGTKEGVSRFDGRRFESFRTADGLSGDWVISMAEDRDGVVWLGTWGGGLTRYDGIRFEAIGRDHELHPTAWGATAVTTDVSGRLLVGGYHGVDRLGANGFEPLPWPEKGAGKPVSALWVDGPGDLWVGCNRGGGVRIEDGDATTFGTDDGLAGSSVHAIHRDREGYLWLATSGGLSRYDGRALVTYRREREGTLAEWCSVLDAGDGNLWLGGEGFEVVRYDGDLLHPYAMPAYRPADGGIWQDAHGDVWFKVQDGVMRFDGQTFEQYGPEDAAPYARVFDLLPAPDGSSWLATGPGLMRRDTAGHVEPASFAEHLETRFCTAIHRARDGAVWFGAPKGVHRYDGETVTRIRGLDDPPLRVPSAFAEDRLGRMWLGTHSHGVYRVEGDSALAVTREDGLAHSSIRSMILDDRGHLWCGTAGGVISRFDGQVWQTLTDRDGLTGRQVSSLVQSDDGSVWIASYGGLQRYRYPEAVPPEVQVEAVTADRRYARPEVVRFASTVPLVAIEFSSHSLKTRPGAMVYRYRLRGLDEEWHTTREERIEYESLPRGAYTFEVEAVDRDLVYSEEPARVRIEVHPPYERLAWIGALLLAVAGIAWQTGRVVRRDRRLRTANTELGEANLALSTANEELAAANLEIREATQRKSEFLRRMSHDLRTPMNAIIGYARLLLRKLSAEIEPRQARNLVNIQTSANNLLNLINEILDLSRVEAGRVEVNLREVDLGELASTCADEVASLVPSGVELKRELAEAPAVRTDPEIVRKVLMNLLGNAVKFTEAGSITVSLAAVDDGVELRVSDTGVGIPPEDLPHIFEEFRQVERQGSTEKEGTGLGLAIAHKSVELLGGSLTAESEVGVGTSFMLRLQREEVAQ